jgi:hypothetical protein
MSEQKQSHEIQQSADDISEHGVRVHHEASEGFDRTEPSTPAVWAFTIGSIIILVVVIIALQQYFISIWNNAVYEKVLAAPSQELQNTLNQNSYDLTHYSYVDKSKGVVRIPLERAEELVLQDAAQGKTFYPAKDTKPKTDEELAAEAKQAAAKTTPPANANKE